MGKPSDQKFLELGHREVSAKFSHLAKNQTEIKVWQKGQEALICKVVGYEFQEGIRVQLLRDSLPNEWINKDALLSFDFNNVHYFATSTVLAGEDEFDHWLVLDETIYKTEKRENERLLTFPHYQFYSYFRILSANEVSNVISLNKHKESDAEVFKRFNQEQSKEILDISEENIEDDLVGFRIMDVSGSGVSFLANEKERNYFEQAKGQPNLSFTLMMDGKNYFIDSAQVVYIVDYVNPRAQKVSTFKVGLKFDNNKDLAGQIDNLLKSSNNLGEDEKEFENLV